jgi:DNA (cytosine-5)-methyltransferase 1
MNTQLNELHLFAGAGGGILGGMLCGHTTVCAVEIEPYCRKVLLQRQRDGILPKFPIWDDVRTFDGKPWRGKVDIVCGGFPCQDISCAGKGAGIEGSRSSMWKHMARIIGEVRPRYAFVENSPMLVGRGLGTVLADLAEMGYDAEWGIVGAHHVSAPHRRDRIWIVATDSNLCRCDDGSYPERQHEANNAEVRQAKEDQQSGSIWQHWTSSHGCDVANATSQGLQGEQRQKPQGFRVGFANKSQDVANSNLPQRKGMRCTSRSNQEHADIVPRCSWWGQDPAEAPKSNVGRMAHGVASRVDRLKAIGNGQVSAVAALAWSILKP